MILEFDKKDFRMNINNSSPPLTSRLLTTANQSIQVASQPSENKNTELPYSEELKFSKTVFKGGVDRSQMDPLEARKLTIEYDRRADDARRVLTNTTFDMRDDYFQVQSDIMDNNPELLTKDWDFTVDEKGDLLIIEGKDSLSIFEKSLIKNVLEDNDMDKYMSKISDSVIERGIATRGPEQYMSGHGIGSFDISKENASSLLRGRELMSDTRVRDTPRGIPEELRAQEAYNSNKLTPLLSIMKQLTARAEELYRYDPNVEVFLNKSE